MTRSPAAGAQVRRAVDSAGLAGGSPFVGAVRNDIRIILAAVFGLYALVASGFGTLLKRRSAE